MEYNNLRQVRQKQKLLVGELSEESGVPTEEIHRLESTNLFPESIETEEALAKALDCPRENLFVRDLD